MIEAWRTASPGGEAATIARVRRATVLAALLLALLAGDARGDTRPPIRAAEQTTLDAAMLQPAADGRFHGEWLLTGAQLRGALAVVADLEQTALVPVAGSERVSVAGFHSLLIAQLGLSDVAATVQNAAAGAGLTPPARFGAEVVARMLGLRINHPAREERSELYPWEAITRAEAAWSLAQVYDDLGRAGIVRETLAAFALPAYSEPQRRALSIAVSKIGMPYVWGGELDHPGYLWGYQANGGYDCSGFAWRVFKLGPDPPAAGKRIHGRTAAQQAGEIARSARIRLAGVAPGDLLFYGRAKFWQRATERGITHMAIALGNGWMIQASAQGVNVAPLAGPLSRTGFAWARRVL
jgi:cell wall-associated NlpC family hydrolase